MNETDLLIIGAGPYGLAVASYAGRLGLECMVVGDPMSFWRDHMPAGMKLRSPTSWHLDAAGELTFEEFLRTRELTPAQVSPISLGLYLEYGEWFRRQSSVEVRRAYVKNLAWQDRGSATFLATLVGRPRKIVARRVLAATGLTRYRKHSRRTWRPSCHREVTPILATTLTSAPPAWQALPYRGWSPERFRVGRPD